MKDYLDIKIQKKATTPPANLGAGNHYFHFLSDASIFLANMFPFSYLNIYPGLVSILEVLDGGFFWKENIFILFIFCRP